MRFLSLWRRACLALACALVAYPASVSASLEIIVKSRASSGTVFTVLPSTFRYGCLSSGGWYSYAEGTTLNGTANGAWNVNHSGTGKAEIVYNSSSFRVTESNTFSGLSAANPNIEQTVSVSITGVLTKDSAVVDTHQKVLAFTLKIQYDPAASNNSAVYAYAPMQYFYLAPNLPAGAVKPDTGITGGGSGDPNGNYLLLLSQPLQAIDSQGQPIPPVSINIPGATPLQTMGGNRVYSVGGPIQSGVPSWFSSSFPNGSAYRLDYGGNRVLLGVASQGYGVDMSYEERTFPGIISATAGPREGGMPGMYVRGTTDNGKPLAFEVSPELVQKGPRPVITSPPPVHPCFSTWQPGGSSTPTDEENGVNGPVKPPDTTVPAPPSAGGSGGSGGTGGGGSGGFPPTPGPTGTGGSGGGGEVNNSGGDDSWTDDMPGKDAVDKKAQGIVDKITSTVGSLQDTAMGIWTEKFGIAPFEAGQAGEWVINVNVAGHVYPCTIPTSHAPMIRAALLLVVKCGFILAYIKHLIG